jgi:hypothetical protein
MPSSQRINKSNEEYLSPQFTVPIPKAHKPQRVVAFEEWLEQNEVHLQVVYRTLQDLSYTSGRYIFDQKTCPFPCFCYVAYQNSFKYRRHDPNYDEDEDDLPDEYSTHIIF